MDNHQVDKFITRSIALGIESMGLTYEVQSDVVKIVREGEAEAIRYYDLAHVLPQFGGGRQSDSNLFVDYG